MPGPMYAEIVILVVMIVGVTAVLVVMIVGVAVVLVVMIVGVTVIFVAMAIPVIAKLAGILRSTRGVTRRHETPRRMKDSEQ